MGVCTTLGTRLLVAAVALLCLLQSAGAQRIDPEAAAETAVAAMAEMESLVAACEEDAQQFRAECSEILQRLADRLPPDKAVVKIERTGEKLFNKFGKLRAKMEKSLDKIAVKAANRIAKFGGDPALIENLNDQRISLKADTNLMLDEVWGEIAVNQQEIIDGLSGQ
jgi:hypothetical protein